MILKTPRTINHHERLAQLFLRCPQHLKDKIARQAQSSARSIASEVIIRKIKSLDDYTYISTVKKFK